MIRPVFDDPNLVCAAGLAPVLLLAESAGFYDLLDDRLSVGSPNATLKATGVVAGMLTGADSIDDLDGLRHGAMEGTPRPRHPRRVRLGRSPDGRRARRRPRTRPHRRIEERIMESQLVWAFPMPDDLIRAAYWNLHLSENGTDDQKRRLGPASELPRPWDIASCTDPDLRAAVWHWYTDVVTWFNHEYVWDPNAGMIPTCWALHPHLIHEIGVLADQRRRANLALSSNALEEWHRYTVPAFLERLKDRLKQHCDAEHQPWPARSRIVVHS